MEMDIVCKKEEWATNEENMEDSGVCIQNEELGVR